MGKKLKNYEIESDSYKTCVEHVSIFFYQNQKKENQYTIRINILL